MPDWQFLARFLQQPNAVGAIAPSSRFLAAAMLEGIDWPNVRNALEYGPGSGAFTGHILERLPSEAKFLVIERDPVFCRQLRQRHPQLLVEEASVERAPELCQRHGLGPIDAIICSLPWAWLPESVQLRSLQGIEQLLGERGRFHSFAYLQGLPLPASRRFRRRLAERFGQLERSPVIWRNIPPAVVLRCGQPRPSTGPAPSPGAG
jgi:phosphatidylethanolamine/phosphatidyl-N-methylethanolamine N-methyltransferase